MSSHKIVAVLASLCLLGVAATAWAGIPDPTNSYATTVQAPNTVSCVVCPAGDGDAYTQCYLFGGIHANATIDLWVRDINGDPVVLYPATSLWVEFPGMCECPPHACIADAPTDANGHTTFSGPFYGAGCDNTNSTTISLNGIPLNQPGLPIWHNSPDMNCDLVVNLSDVVIFASGWFTTCPYCVDFYWDGVCNLSDVVIMAAHIAHTCP
jgi:hypothetical protein